MQKSSLLKKGLYKTIVKEQSKARYQRRLSAILWDTFTGSAPYADIMQRGLDPRMSASFILNMLNGKIKKSNDHV